MTKVLYDWNDQPIRVPSPGENPCITKYGIGPIGWHCKECAHLIRVGGHARDYRKCDLRKITNGKASDHKVSWPACARFEKKNL